MGLFHSSGIESRACELRCHNAIGGTRHPHDHRHDGDARTEHRHNGGERSHEHDIPIPADKREEWDMSKRVLN